MLDLTETALRNGTEHVRQLHCGDYMVWAECYWAHFQDCPYLVLFGRPYGQPDQEYAVVGVTDRDGTEKIIGPKALAVIWPALAQN